MTSEKFELVMVLINTGFSETAMNAAREAGAHGGTIIHARGTGTKDFEKKYGVIITPDKEIIMIIVNKKIEDAVMSAVNKAAGIETKAHGIVFSLPISNVSGLKFD